MEVKTRKEKINKSNSENLVDVKPGKLHPYRNLGFSKLETAEITKYLNPLLCSYMVHYQKLRNFHWNVKGAEFFELHEKFEELYGIAGEQIDDIAERIRVFGQKPVSTLDGFIKHSKIKEPVDDLTSVEMVREILDDYSQLLLQLTETLDQAIENGDMGTERLMQKYIERTEKYHWMFSAYLKRA